MLMDRKSKKSLDGKQSYKTDKVHEPPDTNGSPKRRVSFHNIVQERLIPKSNWDESSEISDEGLTSNISCGNTVRNTSLNAHKKQEHESADKQNFKNYSLQNFELGRPQQQTVAHKERQKQRIPQQRGVSKEQLEQQYRFPFEIAEYEQQKTAVKQQPNKKQEQQEHFREQLRQRIPLPKEQSLAGSTPSDQAGDDEKLSRYISSPDQFQFPLVDSSFLFSRVGSPTHMGSPANSRPDSPSDPRTVRDISRLRDSGRSGRGSPTLSNIGEERLGEQEPPAPSVRSRRATSARLNSKELPEDRTRTAQHDITSHTSNQQSHTPSGRRVSQSPARSPSVSSVKGRETYKTFSDRTCRVSSADDVKTSLKSRDHSPKQPAPRIGTLARRASSPSKDTLINHNVLNHKLSQSAHSASDVKGLGSRPNYSATNLRHDTPEGGDRRSNLSRSFEPYSVDSAESQVSKRSQAKKRTDSGFREEGKQRFSSTSRCEQNILSELTSNKYEPSIRPLRPSSKLGLSSYQSGEEMSKTSASLLAAPTATPRISTTARPSAAPRPSSFRKAAEDPCSANSVSATISKRSVSTSNERQNEKFENSPAEVANTRTTSNSQSRHRLYDKSLDCVPANKTTTIERDRSSDVPDARDVAQSAVANTKPSINKHVGPQKSAHQPMPEPRKRVPISTASNHSLDRPPSDRGAISVTGKDSRQRLTANDHVRNRTVISPQKSSSNLSISSHISRMTRNRIQTPPCPVKGDMTSQAREQLPDTSPQHKDVKEEKCFSNTGSSSAGYVDNWPKSGHTQFRSKLDRVEENLFSTGQNKAVPDKLQSSRSSSILLSQMDLALNRETYRDSKSYDSKSYDPKSYDSKSYDSKSYDSKFSCDIFEPTSRLPRSLPRRNLFDPEIDEQQTMYPQQLSSNRFEPGILLFVFLGVIMLWRLFYHLW